MRCGQGKARVKGSVAPPFYWTVPSEGLVATGFSEGAHKISQKTNPDGKEYLFPALLPPRRDITNAGAFATAPMSMGVLLNP